MLKITTRVMLSTSSRQLLPCSTIPATCCQTPFPHPCSKPGCEKPVLFHYRNTSGLTQPSYRMCKQNHMKIYSRHRMDTHFHAECFFTGEKHHEILRLVHELFRTDTESIFFILFGYKFLCLYLVIICHFLSSPHFFHYQVPEITLSFKVGFKDFFFR